MDDFLEKFFSALPPELNSDCLLRLCGDDLWKSDWQTAAAIALAQCGVFDGKEYLERYPDVAMAGWDPVWHYVRHGCREKRRFPLMPGFASTCEDSSRRASAQTDVPLEKRDSSMSGGCSVIIPVKQGGMKTMRLLSWLKKQERRPVQTLLLPATPDLARECRRISEDDIRVIAGTGASLSDSLAAAYIAPGEYAAIIDEDFSPGDWWLENALRCCRDYNSLSVAHGKLYNCKDDAPAFLDVESGPAFSSSVSCADSDIYCDFGLGAWVLKREWLGNAAESRPSDNSVRRAMRLSRNLWLNGGINTIVPMQPQFESRLGASLEAGRQNINYASLAKEMLDGGYEPVFRRDNLYRIHIITVFGERDLLERCLLSIKAQVHKNYTCTLVDDCHDGKDSLELLKRHKLDPGKFRYIRTKRKLYAPRTHELANDWLGANPADIIAHLDGDDWFAHPHVLSQLNAIYRLGNPQATYGNILSINNHSIRDFSEYGNYEISRRWNVAQNDHGAPVLPFGRLNAEDVSAGWERGPWSGLALRSFRFACWIGINRSAFFYPDGGYIDYAYDAAIMIPILNNMDFSKMRFICDVNYIYQNCSNTTHAKREDRETVTKREASARAVIAAADKKPDREAICAALRRGISAVPAPDAEIISADREFRISELAPNQLRKQHSGAVITGVTPDYLADGIASLMSFIRNTKLPSQGYVFLATEDEGDIAQATALLAGTPLKVLHAGSLKHVKAEEAALAARYGKGSDGYRWGLKASLLKELLESGSDNALWLDPDMFTVADITDIHTQIQNHSLCVFPHFRDPDRLESRRVLYKDGFFNGGILGATAQGIPHLEMLHRRCIANMEKNESKEFFVDQKYFDHFIIECKDLWINKDHGIDYNTWNSDWLETLAAPTPRSFLLHSGFFARVWHMTGTLVKEAIAAEYHKTAALRLSVVNYMLIKLFIAELVRIRSGRCVARAASFADVIRKISPDVAIPSINGGKKRMREDWEASLARWLESALDSICFDSYALLAFLLESFFPDSQTAREGAKRLCQKDFRYITEQVEAAPALAEAERRRLRETENAGAALKRRLARLKNSHISWRIAKKQG